MWYVYVILTTKNKLYTGISTDPVRRFVEHLCDSKKGAKYFRSDSPQKIVHLEEWDTMSEALVREAEIKKWSSFKKRSTFSREYIHDEL
ncbi:MAG: GIY-YIG nuclease family protein [Bacteriovorax sp.]|nr:GIY-YIG nuclease family protein [Bacteriovorax sp.]